MFAAVLHQPGGPENFKFEERPIPIPEAGQVLIRVRAFGLNRSEIMTRKGLSPDVQFPRILGIECVGEVEEDPSHEFKKGQKVAAYMGNMGRLFDGSYAEFAVLPKAIITNFESSLPWETLGALPEMFQTAYGSLHIALRIKAGETILIRGGTSSVGLLATQLAKSHGLYVVATTRDERKRSLLLENGADEVLIDDRKIFEKAGISNPPVFDKILELIGTTTLKDSLKGVVAGGSVCMTGMLSEQWSISEFEPMGYIPAAVNLTVYDSGQIRVAGNIFQQFILDIEAGKVMPVIKNTFKLKDLSAAHQFMESNSGGGKIVVLT